MAVTGLFSIARSCSACHQSPVSTSLSPVRIALFVVGTALAIATLRADDDEHPAAKKSEAPKHEGLTLDAAAQARIGLEVRKLVPARITAVAVAHGTVLDPSPLALLDAELDGSAAALVIAHGQEKRERELFERDQIVARPALEAAQLQVQAAETRHETAVRRLATEWGDGFAKPTPAERHALVARLLRREVVLLRVELPAGETLSGTPSDARVTTLASDRGRSASWFCDAPTVDARTQGRGFLFQAPGPDPGLRPGTAVTAHIAQEGPAKPALLVPTTAVVRHLGLAWVYLAEAEGRFRKQAVALDRLTADGWATTTALPDAASVVTQGAQLLLSDELKARSSAE